MRKILLVFLFCLWLSIAATAQEATESPIPRERPIESIFSNDICAPPCWFGLIPGESTAQEAVDFLTSSEYVYNPLNLQHGELFPVHAGAEAIEDGQYNFVFLPVEMTVFGHSTVFVYDALLDSIHIEILAYISLEEVIQKMGWPDDIRLSAGYNRDDFYFTFIYYEPFIRLTVGNGESRRREILCNFAYTRDNFFANFASYYSPRSAMEIVDVYVRNGEPYQHQPRLLALQGEERYVPPDLWPIVMGDTAYLCQDLWERLNRERVLPDWAENQ